MVRRELFAATPAPPCKARSRCRTRPAVATTSKDGAALQFALWHRTKRKAVSELVTHANTGESTAALVGTGLRKSLRATTRDAMRAIEGGGVRQVPLVT